MTTRTKALVAVSGVLAILVIGVLAVVIGARYATPHVPGDSILTIEIAGSIPELSLEFAVRRPLRQPHPVAPRPARRAGAGRLRPAHPGGAGQGAGVQRRVRDDRGAARAARKLGQGRQGHLGVPRDRRRGRARQRQYLLATGCRRIVLGPMGDINITGLASRTPFIRGTLDKLGIVPEFPGIGAYKSARFFYTDKDFTPEAREMTTWLLDSLSGQVAAGIAAGRGITPAEAAGLDSSAVRSSDPMRSRRSWWTRSRTGRRSSRRARTSTGGSSRRSRSGGT